MDFVDVLKSRYYLGFHSTEKSIHLEIQIIF